MRVLAIMAFVLVLAASGVAAYLYGESRAPTNADAIKARDAAYKDSFQASTSQARAVAINRGHTEGIAVGTKLGTSAGREQGESAGSDAASAELLAAERARNCGAPLFDVGYCPTDAEVAQESQIEELCGGGTVEGRQQAAELGVEC
jgi:hypothetical protein